MKLYFSTSQVPELAALTRLRRRLVYQCAFEALLTDQPSMVWVCTLSLFGGLLRGLLAGWMAAGRNGLVVCACGLAGAMIGTFMGAQILTARLRPYFRRVLEDRKDELEQIN
jgi:hypothetical protein